MKKLNVKKESGITLIALVIATRENVIKNQNELKQIGKDVSIGEVLNETINEDSKRVNTYFEVIVDGDIYKVEMSGAKLIGSLNEIGPKISLKNIANTTNTITVNVKVEQNEGGKIEYYIKGEDEEKYTLKETGTNETYIYLNLEQNKKYNIKIVATSKNGRTAEVLANATTGKVADLTTGNTTFEYSTKEWTNGNVTVTAKPTVTGYTVQTSKDGRSWTDTAIQTVTANGTVYARLWDGTNYGGAASGSVTNIDKTKPIVTGVNTTTNSIKITATDEASGIIGYAVTTSTVTPELSNFTTCANTKTLNVTVQNKTQGTAYYVWVKDQAGNISESQKTETKKLEIGMTVKYVPSGTYNWQAKYCSTKQTQDNLLNSAETSFKISEWRILDIVNGKVTLVPTTPTIGKVYLGQAQGYNNGVKLLNDACNNLYGNSSKGITARNMNIGDIEKYMKPKALEEAHQYNNGYVSYNKQISLPYTKEKNHPTIYAREDLSVINGVKKVNGIGLSEQTKFIEKTESSATDGIIAYETSIQPYQTYWNKDNAFMQAGFQTAINGTKYYDLIMPNGASTEYWLSSRCIYAHPEDCSFYMRNVYQGMPFSSHLSHSGDALSGVSDGVSHSLFPVVYLNSELITEDETNKLVVK